MCGVCSDLCCDDPYNLGRIHTIRWACSPPPNVPTSRHPLTNPLPPPPNLRPTPYKPPNPASVNYRRPTQPPIVRPDHRPNIISRQTINLVIRGSTSWKGGVRVRGAPPPPTHTHPHTHPTVSALNTPTPGGGSPEQGTAGFRSPGTEWASLAGLVGC